MGGLVRPLREEVKVQCGCTCWCRSGFSSDEGVDGNEDGAKLKPPPKSIYLKNDFYYYYFGLWLLLGE